MATIEDHPAFTSQPADLGDTFKPTAAAGAHMGVVHWRPVSDLSLSLLNIGVCRCSAGIVATYFAQQDILRGLGLPSAEKCKSLVGLIGIMFYAVLSGPIQFLAMLLQRGRQIFC